jgi:hypothetical protein
MARTALNTVNHDEDGGKMGLRNACDVVCDGPGNPFRIPVKLGGKVRCRAHSGP